MLCFDSDMQDEHSLQQKHLSYIINYKANLYLITDLSYKSVGQ